MGGYRTWVLIFIDFLAFSKGMTVTSSRLPTGTLPIGDNQFTISCTYIKQTNDEVLAIELWRKRSTDNAFVKVVVFPPPTAPSNVTLFDPTLINRTTATMYSDISPTASLAFYNTMCTDKADYQWKIGFTDYKRRVATSTLSIDSLKSLSKFADDGVLTLTPSTNIEEGTEVTFTCSGDVGDVPAGQLAWFMFRYGEISGAEDLSGQATVMAPVAGQCTYSRTSTLKLTMQSNMNNAVIRCTAQQDILDENGDAYKQTNSIPVLYAPWRLAIKKEPNYPAYAEGAQSLKLTCSTDANPAASYYWVLPDTQITHNRNITNLAGAVLTLTNLRESDSGKYTCVGYNTIHGQVHTVNTSVEILVQLPNICRLHVSPKQKLISGHCISANEHTYTYCAGTCGVSTTMPHLVMDGGDGSLSLDSSCKCCAGIPGDKINLTMLCTQFSRTYISMATIAPMKACHYNVCIGGSASP